MYSSNRSAKSVPKNSKSIEPKVPKKLK